jgi:hypothetical protein
MLSKFVNYIYQLNFNPMSNREVEFFMANKELEVFLFPIRNVKSCWLIGFRWLFPASPPGFEQRAHLGWNPQGEVGGVAP